MAPDSLARMVGIRYFDRELRQEKIYFEGTHRTRSPAETIRANRPLMSAMGITRLANVTGLDYIGLPVYMSVRPNARTIAVSQGKGLNAAAAAASALMESIELWHAEHYMGPVHVASYTDMIADPTKATLDVTGLPRPVEAPFSVEAPTGWTVGFDVMRQVPIWVPFDVAATEWTTKKSWESMFLESTNGLASGNHFLEAVVHGLCEVIERDATCLWSLDGSATRTKGAQLDPDTVDDPHCRAVIELFRSAHIHVAMWDVTSDLGIPSYSVAILDEPGWHGRPLSHGSGTHLSPAIALLRALTEAAQSRLTEIAGSRDDIPVYGYASRLDEAQAARIIRYFSRPSPRRDFRARRSLTTSTFEDDVAVMLAALEAAGITTVAVVDLSRPEISIPVVKVIVPGLECGSHGGKEVTLGGRGRRRLAELEALDVTRRVQKEQRICAS